MLKMMIHMRRYAWMLAAVVVLLAAQAACELWLPTYTAAIVDVGIQQEGVESPVPEAVRESALEGLLARMDAETAARVRAAYAPADAAWRDGAGGCGAHPAGGRGRGGAGGGV